jgi:hypothetical protein
MNAIEKILANENPLASAKLAADETQNKWKMALETVNKEFASKSDEFLQAERVQAVKVAELSRFMII